MNAVKLNRLAQARGQKLLCEICGKPAAYGCSKCPTYYCTLEHYSDDWDGILKHIAPEITILRSQPRRIGSEEERNRREDELNAIRAEALEVCYETSQKYIVQGNYRHAVPGALHALKLAVEAFGGDALELVPAYLLLAEGNLGLRHLEVAEEFLSLANWAVLRHPQRGYAMMSNLQRNFGRLYAAQQRFQEALQAFATDIYYSALEFGPENIRTAPSYFHMGRVFQTHQNPEFADNFYTKVVDIYRQWLETSTMTARIFNTEWPAVEHTETGMHEMSVVEVQEAVEIIKHTSSHRQKRLGTNVIPTGEARYVLGLLSLLTQDTETATESLTAALAAFESESAPQERVSKCKEALNYSLQKPQGIQDVLAAEKNI
eukprot:GHVT01072337.1.p1 GENE.GHVT01072337.1~~GHVT01072337.1.p1  ORF type:complete len:375 (+),score=30.93 GHVT01072337.1:297-1421(+)